MAVVLAAVLLASCASPPPDEGFVVEHRYDDPDTYFVNGSCTYSDKNGVCLIHTQEERHDEAHWYLRIENCVRNDEGKEKCQAGDVEVDEPVFSSIRDGQYVKVNKDDHTMEVVPR